MPLGNMVTTTGEGPWNPEAVELPPTVPAGVSAPYGRMVVGMGEDPGPTVTVATEPDSVGIEADGVYVTTTGVKGPKG